MDIKILNSYMREMKRLNIKPTLMGLIGYKEAIKQKIINL